MKPNEASGSFKLSDLATNPETDNDLPVSDHANKKSSTTTFSSKEQNERTSLRDLSQFSLSKSSGASSGPIVPEFNKTGFSWLKEGASLDSLPESWTRNRDFTQGLASRGSGGKDGQSAGERLAELTQRIANPADDGSEERRLARKFTARFEEPTPPARQTLVSALTPYMAATGFFVFIAGGSAIYFIADKSSPNFSTSGSARAAPRPPLESKSFEKQDTSLAAWSLTIAAQKPLEEQPTFQRTSINFGSGPVSATMTPALTPKPEEKGSKVETGTQEQAPSSNLNSWAETVETFKQYIATTPASRQARAATPESERLLERLEAWQNEKK